MLSAFGVEHGEVSKAILRPPRVRGAQIRTRGQGPKSSRTQSAKNKLNAIGEADISLKGIGGASGRGLTRAGSFVQRHPGLTGTALVGGGSVGGYKYLTKDKKR